MPSVTATIPLSGSVSGDIDLRRAIKGVIAISVPVVNSGDLLVQGGFDSTSASFTRLLQTPPNSGHLRFATGLGSTMIAWPNTLPVPSYLRLETAVPQAAARSFTILFR